MVVREKKILVVEDDPGLQKQLKWAFADYDVSTAGERQAALDIISRKQPQVVTLDLGLPPDPDGATEGLHTLENILQAAPNTKVIMVTGNEDREAAVRAISMGAYDFYQKPIDAEVLGIIVQRAFKLYELEEENRELTKHAASNPLPGIIATSQEMLKACRVIEKIAPTNVTTLLLGESGTGKEVLARALHELSARASKKFVAINCAAIPENLLESELFGYEKGAFTGATKRTIGKIEIAEGGTLMLDEIGDLPLPLQGKLLRFLQERVIERLGGREEIPVDVRVVSATHQDLKNLIAEGKFREDLYYRLSEVTIEIPPLRNRTGDVGVIAQALLDDFAKEQGVTRPRLSKDAVVAIEAYDWPGNIRELINRIKRGFVMCENNKITAFDLELETSGTFQLDLNLRRIREEVERQTVMRALMIDNGNISKAAMLLGVSRPTLYDLINKFDLKNMTKQ